MRVLHLSDLHRSDSKETLRDLWRPAAQALAPLRGEIDFVVVSGDLSREAKPAEYDELHELLGECIEPLLRPRTGESVKPRVILIPGNRDVDWGVPAYRHLALTELAPDALTSVVRDALAQSEDGNRRWVIGPMGHVAFFEIDRELYAKRFASVQRFLDEYYGETLTTPHRRFDLQEPTGVGAWSAHVFFDDRIAFLGFSSCHDNDRYWHGARILSGAVTAAQAHLDGLAHARAAAVRDDVLRVAAWHHGLEGPRGRADHLTLEDLAALANAGVRVGCCGHVQNANQAVHSFLADDFALISTGSLAIDDNSGRRSQFSVVDLVWNRAHVKVYEHDREAKKYAPRRDRERYLYFSHEPRADGLHAIRSRARSMTRALRLNSTTGVAEVIVVLDDLVPVGRLLLAHLTGDFRCAGDPHATVGPDGSADLLAVRATPLDQDEPVFGAQAGQRFELDGAGRSPLPRVRWSYRFSNGLALTEAELTTLDPRVSTFPRLRPGYEIWAYNVHLDLDRLVLEFRTDAASGDAPFFAAGVDAADVVCVVERRDALGEWERVLSEERRGRCHIDGNGFVILWDAPIVGYRYGAMFRLGRPGTPLATTDGDALAALVRTLRGERRRGHALRDEACDFVRRQTELALGLDDPPWPTSLVIVGMLWDQTSRRLHPCFGDFPPKTWGRSFRCGDAIAGHAYRFARPAAWHADAQGSGADLLLVPPSATRAYHWILSLPLRTREGGPAVGVLTFASTEDESPVSRELSDLARFVARQPQTQGKPERLPHLDDLWSLVCASFWIAVSNRSADLPRSVADLAERCLREWS